MIAGKEYYDRAFIFTMVLYSFVVGQLNVRAYYTRLSGIIEANNNTWLYRLGMGTIFFPPMISILDMYTFPNAHNVCAFAFFTIAAAYIIWITGEFSAHKEEFE